MPFDCMQVDLNGFSEAAEPTLRFLAMLVGPFYPILRVVNERSVELLSMFLKILWWHSNQLLSSLSLSLSPHTDKSHEHEYIYGHAARIIAYTHVYVYLFLRVCVVCIVTVSHTSTYAHISVCQPGYVFISSCTRLELVIILFKNRPILLNIDLFLKWKDRKSVV